MALCLNGRTRWYARDIGTEANKVTPFFLKDKTRRLFQIGNRVPGVKDQQLRKDS